MLKLRSNLLIVLIFVLISILEAGKHYHNFLSIPELLSLQPPTIMLPKYAKDTIGEIPQIKQFDTFAMATGCIISWQ